MNYFLDILLAIGIVFAAAGFGRKLARVLRVPEGGFWETFCTAAALGLGVLILTVFFLGVAGLLRRWILILPPLLFVAAAPKDLIFIVKTAARRTASFFANAEPLHRALAAGTVFFFIIYIPAALAPPVHPDALLYQLAAPKIYAQAGRIVFLPDNFRASLPSGVNMLFTLALVLRGAALAQLLHLALGALGALALFAVGSRWLGRFAGLLAAFIFSSQYLVSLVAPQALTEMGFVLFGVLAFHYLMLRFESGSPGELVLSALFCGFALTTRYQAGAFFVCLTGFLFAAELKRRKSLVKAAGPAILYGAIAIAIMAPWLVKNAVFIGNPVFPALNQFFGNRFCDMAHRSSMLTNLKRPDSLIGYTRLFFLYPWLATMNGSTNDTAYSTPAGPVFLALLPSLLFFRPIPRFVRSTLWFCLAAGIVFWGMMMINPRFWLPVQALLCIAIAFSVSEARTRSKPVYVILLFFIALNALFTVSTVFYGRNSVVSQIDVMAGKISRDSYIAERSPAYRAVAASNRELPPGSKIWLLFNAGQGYYLDRPYLYGEPYMQTYFDWTKLRSGPDLLAWIREKGITHVIFQAHYARRGSIADLAPPEASKAWDWLIQNHFRPVKVIDDFMIGEIVK